MAEQMTMGQQEEAVKARSAAAELARPPESLWRDAWRRLLRNRAAVVSGVFVLVLIFVAIFADDGLYAWILGREPEPLLAPYG